MKMTTGLAVGIGVGPFATKQPEGSSNALDAITSSNGAWWVVAERDGSDNLVDQTGGGRNLTLPGGSANPVLLDHTGTDYFWFPGTTGNNLSIAGLSATTTYDYTVTYSDTTTNTGSETTDGSGNLVFGNTQTNFNLKRVTKIEVEPSGGGALVADVRATSADPDATTFPELISALTVTINRTTSGYKMEVVEQPYYAGATDDYLETAASSLFQVGASQDFTAVFVGRFHHNASLERYMSTFGLGTGWYIQNVSGNVRAVVDDGPTATSIGAGATLTTNAVAKNALVRDTNADTLKTYANGNTTSVTDGTTGSIGDTTPTMQLFAAEASLFANCVLIGAAFIKGTAWTDSEISDIADALVAANGGAP